MDNKFSLEEHIKIKTTAATRAYYALKSLATSQNGKSVQNLCQIYTATIIPVILWSRNLVARTENNDKKVEKPYRIK
jgi:hypothetical protein